MARPKGKLGVRVPAEVGFVQGVVEVAQRVLSLPGFPCGQQISHELPEHVHAGAGLTDRDLIASPKGFDVRQAALKTVQRVHDEHVDLSTVGRRATDRHVTISQLIVVYAEDRIEKINLDLLVPNLAYEKGGVRCVVKAIGNQE